MLGISVVSAAVLVRWRVSGKLSTHQGCVSMHLVHEEQTHLLASADTGQCCGCGLSNAWVSVVLPPILYL